MGNCFSTIRNCCSGCWSAIGYCCTSCRKATGEVTAQEQSQPPAKLPIHSSTKSDISSMGNVGTGSRHRGGVIVVAHLPRLTSWLLVPVRKEASQGHPQPNISSGVKAGVNSVSGHKGGSVRSSIPTTGKADKPLVARRRNIARTLPNGREITYTLVQ